MTINVNYKIGIQLSLALLNWVALSPQACLPLQVPIFLNFEIITLLTCQGTLSSSQGSRGFSGRFSFKSKLLIFFSWQLTSVIGLDFTGGQLDIQRTWQGKEPEKIFG